MKKLFILFIAILMTGCVTQQRCLVKFPPDTITQIETVHHTEYKDTIVYKYLPGDTVYAEKEIILTKDSIIYVTVDPVRVETELATAKAWIVNRKLKLLLQQKDSVLQFKLDSAIRLHTDTIVYTNQVVHKVPVKKPVTSYFFFWVMVGLFALTLIVVLIKSVK